MGREGGMQELRRGHVRPAGSAVWLAATGSLAQAAPVEGEGGRQEMLVRLCFKDGLGATFLSRQGGGRDFHMS